METSPKLFLEKIINKNSFSIVIVAVIAIACSGVGGGSGQPTIQPAGSGSIMDNVKSNQNCTWAGDITTNNESGCVWGKDGGKPVGEKTGKACSTSILNAIRSGDMSIAAAAKQGGIKKVQSVDASINTILNSLYVESCILVNGT